MEIDPRTAFPSPPSPLRGGIEGGGLGSHRRQEKTPTPSPSPQGGGEQRATWVIAMAEDPRKPATFADWAELARRELKDAGLDALNRDYGGLGVRPAYFAGDLPPDAASAMPPVVNLGHRDLFLPDASGLGGR